MSEQLTKWTPSDNQLSAIKHMEENDYGVTIGALCELVGISTRAYYKWFNSPEFSQWWTDQVNRHFAQQIHRVHQATIASATGHKQSYGSQDRKLFYERFDKDYMPKTRQETADVTTFEDQLAKYQAQEKARFEAEKSNNKPD